MYGSDYFTEMLVRDRQAELRALAASCALRRTLREPRRSLRVRLGRLLIRGGRWLARRRPTWPVEHGRPA